MSSDLHILKTVFRFLCNPIKFLNEPYYIVRDNKLYYPNGELVPTYDGNDRKWHPNRTNGKLLTNLPN